ncbi:MAG: trehalose-phosphatase [Nitriliruptoraceae bacterium]
MHEPLQLAVSMPPGPRTLVLDFDGTLAPIVDIPDDARLVDGADAVLRQLGGQVPIMVLSGRDLDDIAPRLDGLPVDVAGNHGARLATADGEHIELVDIAASAATLAQLAERLDELLGDDPGWFVEAKPTSVAVHHRLVAEDEVELLLPRVEALLVEAARQYPGFDVLHGKAVVEFRVSTVDKGAAVDWFVARHPNRPPIALGDDITDEDAFAAAIRHGGCAILVGRATHETHATTRLADPRAVIDFLALLADAQAKV